jgi:general secretion pathway protein N
VRATVHAPDIGPPFNALWRPGLNGGTWQFESWQGRAPLGALSGLGAPFNTLALQGNAQLTLNTRHTNTPGVQLTFSSLRSALAQGVLLGDYAVQGELTGVNAGAFTLATQRGILKLSGKGRCTLHRRMTCQFAGEAEAAERDRALLGNLLGLLGKTRVASDADTTKAVTELRW